jgi:hypothetical protein
MALRQFELPKSSQRREHAKSKTSTLHKAQKYLGRLTATSGFHSSSERSRSYRSVWDQIVTVAFLGCLVLFLRALTGLGHQTSVVATAGIQSAYRESGFIVSNSNMGGRAELSGQNGSSSDVSHPDATIREGANNDSMKYTAYGGLVHEFLSDAAGLSDNRNEESQFRSLSGDELWEDQSDFPRPGSYSPSVDPFYPDSFYDGDGINAEVHHFALKIRVKPLRPSTSAKTDFEVRCQGSGGVRC